MSVKPGFRRGTKAADDAAKANSGGFKRSHFFNLEEGKSEILRFITEADEFITVAQHNMVQTKGAPADFDNSKGSWPKSIGSVCRYDEAFTGLYSDCYVCDHMTKPEGKPYRPSPRQWALAVEREEVLDENGRKAGYKDRIRTVTIPAKDGKPESTTQEPAVVIVNMGHKNFFSTIIGFAERYGTILDRDYFIRRKGAGLDTTYDIVPEDPIHRADGTVYTTADPKVMEKYDVVGLDLGDEILRRSTDEFYGRFFDPNVTVPTKTAEGGAPAEQQVKPPTEPSPDRLAELAQRIKGGPEESPEPVAAGRMQAYE